MKEFNAYYTSNAIITVKALSLEEAKAKVPSKITEALSGKTGDLWCVEEAR